MDIIVISFLNNNMVTINVVVKGTVFDSSLRETEKLHSQNHRGVFCCDYFVFYFLQPFVLCHCRNSSIFFPPHT